ncbi:MAG: DMT family transporter [Pseudomonadota bacterium]
MSPALTGHAAMLFFSALVTESFSLGAQAANDLEPAALNAVRFWMAAGIIWLVVRARASRPLDGVQAPWRYAVLGGFFAAYFFLMFEGLKTAPPVSAAAVFTLTPVMAAGFGWVLLRQVTTPRMALALTIGAAGALWVIFRADLSALLAFEVGRGEVVYFIGCVSHAVYTPLVRRLNRGEGAFVFSFWTLVACAGWLTIVGAGDLLSTDWHALPGIVWVAILYTAVFASAVSFVLLQVGAMRLPAAKVMAYTYLTPSWVILWEIAFGNGVPGALVWGGVALTVVALGLLLREG